jgi:hypothetical protein
MVIFKKELLPPPCCRLNMLAFIRIIAIAACAAIAVSLKIDYSKVWIIQDKGGGHGTIGYLLSMQRSSGE